jgi:hypothetical protein
MVTNTTQSDMERMEKAISEALEALSSGSKLQRLLSILESERYVERLVQKLQQKLSKMSKMNGQLGSLERQRSTLTSTMEHVRQSSSCRLFVCLSVCLSLRDVFFLVLSAVFALVLRFAKGEAAAKILCELRKSAESGDGDISLHYVCRWYFLTHVCSSTYLLNPAMFFRAVVQVVRCQLLERSINCNARIAHINMQHKLYLANTRVIMNDWSRLTFMPIDRFRFTNSAANVLSRVTRAY